MNFLIKSTKKTTATKYRLKKVYRKRCTLLNVLAENFHEY